MLIVLSLGLFVEQTDLETIVRTDFSTIALNTEQLGEPIF